MRDEAFTRNLIWKSSSSLVSSERGDLQNEFIEITEDEANHLMEELRPGGWPAIGMVTAHAMADRRPGRPAARRAHRTS